MLHRRYIEKDINIVMNFCSNWRKKCEKEIDSETFGGEKEGRRGREKQKEKGIALLGKFETTQDLTSKLKIKQGITS